MKLSELILKTNSFLKNDLPQFEELIGINSRKELIKNINFLNKTKGVYVFEHSDNGVIYIGSSGKVNRKKNKNSEICLNGLGSRLIRSSTPYSFVNENLCYDKIINSDSKKKKSNYYKSFLLNDIKIYYIKTGEIPFTVPTVLEHLLIQVYYHSGKLPLINNQL
ncbi:hypothetical protein [uncultured Lutibacter sp.]|uniref:hypothetical protein n=1 Tax=uncultured Lutibacter sp. TaxID=437739 RepID=UPI0026193A36|nr:hypothetical protein [uncultured Lutibacter sp.]